MDDIQNHNFSDAYICFSQWLKEFDFEKMN